MNKQHSSKSMFLSLSAFGLAMLSYSGVAQASGDDTYCDGVDVNGKHADCALSTVCGAVSEHFPKPFTGNFDAYFDLRTFEDVTCEILAYKKQVHYQCQDSDGKKHRGQFRYSSYPLTKPASEHFKVCEGLLRRYPKKPGCDKPQDPGCQKPQPDPDKKPGCDKPQDPGCQKPQPDPDKKPGCDKPQDPGCKKPQPDPDKKPGCDKPQDPGCDEPKADSFAENCYSHAGKCSVVGKSVAGNASGLGSNTSFTVSCSCNIGVSWGYSETGTYFETVGAEQLQDVCEEEIQLCRAPFDGGQGSVFGLEDHKDRKTNAKCESPYGACKIDSNAAGNGYVSCSCYGDDGISHAGMKYGMEPGVRGATEECFAELDICHEDVDHCPGGCDKGSGVKVVGCSLSPDSDRGPLGAMFMVFAGLAGLGFRRRR